MKIPALFKEYIWLIEALGRAGRLTFAEINELWRQRPESGGVSFSRTTFNRHRDAILDMFGIIIDCDRRDGYRYYIYNREVLEEETVSNWMYSTLSVSNMLDENVALHDRILLESVPSGDTHLQEIIRAMRESRRVAVTYQRYGTPSGNRLDAAPYCVKLFRRRWYVLMKVRRTSSCNDHDNLAVFSLDRIKTVELLKEKFTLPHSFNAAAFFDECFGIVVGDGTKPERIVVRAYGHEPHYMRDLPLHHTQRELGSDDGHTDFEYFMRPTPDFKGHIMSRGEWLQVLSPQWLADEIGRWLQAALARYAPPR